LATFTTESIVRTRNGLGATYNATNAGGDKFTPGDKTILHFKNTNAATRTVTIVTPGTVAEFAEADMTAVIPATTGDKFLGPFPAYLFAGSDGYASMSYDAVTGLTVAVIQIP
jgi:hypothetical protein